MHRDIKLENILVTQGNTGGQGNQGGQRDKMTVKLTDFGFACFFESDNQLKVNLGTPLYMAPEIIKR